MLGKKEQLKQDLLSISKAAGDRIMDIYNTEDIGLTYKDDASPLTLADNAANDVICEFLRLEYPHIPIISEENKQIDYETRRHYEQFWCIDPLDGTKEFVKRNGEFSVNIALIENGKVVAGVVYLPAFEIHYYAAKSQGSYRIENGKETQLHAANYTLKDEGLGIVGSRSHMNESTKEYIAQYDQPIITAKGSSLKFALLAEGKAHVYPRLAPTMEWDTAAPQIVLEEAGGQVLNFETGETLRYNKESLVNPFFVAKAKEVG